MKRIEGDAIPAMEQEILSLMEDIYAASNGEYPALEWVKDRPVPGERGWKGHFEEIYLPFLRYRLKEDVDMLLVEYEDRLTGIAGIKYTRSGSFKGYERLFSSAGIEVPENAAFLEMLAVHPDFRGKGLGRRLLTEALHTISGLKMKGYGVSFPWLKPALYLYSSVGARVLAEVRNHSWEPGDEPSDYVIIEF